MIDWLIVLTVMLLNLILDCNDICFANSLLCPDVSVMLVMPLKCVNQYHISMRMSIKKTKNFNYYVGNIKIIT